MVRAAGSRAPPTPGPARSYRHGSPPRWHRRQVGRPSSHFIRRDLHVAQPARPGGNGAAFRDPLTGNDAWGGGRGQRWIWVQGMETGGKAAYLCGLSACEPVYGAQTGLSWSRSKGAMCCRNCAAGSWVCRYLFRCVYRPADVRACVRMLVWLGSWCGILACVLPPRVVSWYDATQLGSAAVVAMLGRVRFLCGSCFDLLRQLKYLCREVLQ
ncbi:hypothetical protein GGS23DRAFT_452593 [Durotheca rogersii]|uniref:uncharacterized protein n=1 Tax=Durotheca rogersii TaxID=419775 RepID=UPI002220FA5B|nr:uncharacterized protein GGS23DRAFT_452593 [Durotheca rogersii]KAI5864550.1 hypothetical protein GGS23DRAFT_452593 [Durotheca rogersii]